MIGSDELKLRLRELAEVAPQVCKCRDRTAAAGDISGASATAGARLELLGSAVAHLGDRRPLVRGLAGARAQDGGDGRVLLCQPVGVLPLPYAQSDVPLEHAVVVRVNMPRAEASALGRTARSRSDLKGSARIC